MPKPAKKNKNQKSKFNYKNSFLHYLYCLAIIILLLVAGLNIDKFFSNQKVLGEKTDITPLLDEKAYWQDLVDKNPTYIDGYLQLAKVDIEAGNRNEALEFIKTALQLDPNSTKIPQVQKELGL